MELKKSTLFTFLFPAVFLFAVFIFYPILRTIMMSFFAVNTITSPLDSWHYVGLQNYIDLFTNPTFIISIGNIFKIWFITGIATISLSLLFATIVNSNIFGNKFFAKLVYLPEVISPIAIGYAWLLYVFNSNYGLLNSFFSAIGLDSLASIQWTSPDMLFVSMSIAAVFGAIGQYTLMYISAMSRIPNDYYEVARIEGQNSVMQFFTITFPLIKDVIKTTTVLFTTSTIGFFAFARVFGSINTITPMIFTYNQIFGTEINPDTNVGIGAASGVIMTLIGVFFFIVSNYLVKESDYEY
ncbi:sugar ABC transporter permease [Aerococcaceae bacterium INB8]|uniref:Sugar ABC transporter permease n=1 Tax=Ruoffia halotolerans TaxID=2748684 RepID=A0A839A7X6_9LACT|nr:sugar ABC transporter permease [Ruoffia halotolerans]MBA5729900.1 sugar ABC transporter permease [Ruoffia halotolerans]